ncbi:winged helix-turn-helix transcriptional regulator [Candidatus Bathyarchaeota archaeon]|jgi:DNA-binding HxlR family transcriptional regulator|nr:winged helix-turn-helix transcriptional regulator [Candidatus Bathyarchaeota archaeon]MBT4319080.1 winged helix-turn-helix transcriptional regulator [Candidatus Bathyarchaeota archaeon]MBT4424344.1 winged helix-turn-helix transcriptional regulator [Candidatus Bathyarchaeota archaeon]MBT5641654.1 winged helix-turn-helix transcriptional regulator [Candidatus Bathyarchaeota archaeon]MBT6604674.1 winged helix-turn-helix transcriptional regulator [Candidatus Bathyarchaeota archaeon]
MRLDDEISGLRKEISQFRTETRQRLEVIENEVNKQVALNYNRTIVDYVIGMSHDLVANLKCDRPDEEENCKAMLAERQEEHLALLKAGKFTASYNALEKAMERAPKMKQNFEDFGRPGCVSCIEAGMSMLRSNMQLLSQLRLIETPAVSLAQNTATVNSLDAEKANRMIVSPISNKVRIQILQSIYRGENRFNDLSRATGLEGGQLLYHIKKLKEAEYMDQFESKDYVLTPKGMKGLVMLAQLSHELS